MAESDDDMLARLSRKSDAAASSSASSSSSSSSSSGAALSARAAAVYDRSIRVYGVETQQALSASRVLVAGLASGMGAEAAKNLMLAGMSVTLADARPAQGRHLASNFLLSAAELAAAAAAAAPPPSLATASLARLAELNPLAEARAAPLRALDMADEELCAFRCAVLCDLAPAEALALAERLHALRVPVFVLESFGLTAFLFADLGARHAFAVQRSHEGAGGVRAVVTEARELAFPSLRAALRGSWAALKPATTAPAVYAWAALHLAAAAAAAEEEEEGRRGAGGGAPASAAAEGAAAAAAAARHCAAHGLSAAAFPGAAEGACAQLAAARGHALAPVCAVVGGLLGQEVVKLVSARDEPVHNLLCFDSAGLGAVTCAVGCA